MLDNKSLNILMVHHGKGIGGAPKSMSYIAQRLVADGYKVNLLFLQNSNAIDLFKDVDCKKNISKVPIYYFYHMSKWVKVFQFYKFFIQIISAFLQLFFVAPYYIIKTNPDVIYINTSVLPEWVIASKFFRKRVVIHIRESISGGHFGVRRWLLSKIFSVFPDRVIAISGFNRDCAGLRESKRAFVIYNYEKISPDIKKYNKKRYDMLYLGGESYIKGWDCVESLLLTELDFCIAIAGEFKLDTIKKISKDPRVEFLGMLDDPSVVMSESYFLLSPFKEPHFSRPIIEAYAHGAVPIASNLPGVDEQVVNNESGLLFDSNNKHDLVQKICYCLSIKDEKEYDDFLKIGADLFENKFSHKNEELIVEKITKW
jgi:glycosyltransferase involved in cell wall biosynthesis